MEADTPVSVEPKRKRRWYQFSLRTLLILVTLAAIGCWLIDAAIWAPFRIHAPPITSPDGAFTLYTSVGRGSGDPSDKGKLIIEVRNNRDNAIFRANSPASAWQRWDVKWIANDEFLVLSSDIGDFNWKRQPDGTWKSNQEE